MSHWDTIRSNFESAMTGDIPDIEVNEWKTSDAIVSMMFAPSTLFDHGYAILCQGLSKVNGEVNSIVTVTYIVRLQLAMVAPDRTAYDSIVSEMEAVVRHRAHISTWQTVFRQLIPLGVTLESLETDSQWYQLFNCDFEVTLQGT